MPRDTATQGRAEPATTEPGDLAAQRRLQIIAATSEVICRNGVDGARLKDIADEAGVSLGMVQHYFRHRDELVVTTMSSLLELTLATWRVVAAAEHDPVKRLFALLRFQVAGWAPFGKRWSFWVEFWSAASRHDTLNTYAKDVYGAWTEPFRTTIEEGVAAGAFRPTSPTDLLITRLMCLSDGAALRVLFDPDGLSQDGMFDLLIDSACTALGIDEATRDEALATLPNVISVRYPEEPTTTDAIDWAPLRLT
ncbi:MAG: TetR family transcriptional regulator [Streptosporangiales bacterium]|nr:TetR family transcriptional regulator [Streptosporangiales bacterium]